MDDFNPVKHRAIFTTIPLTDGWQYFFLILVLDYFIILYLNVLAHASLPFYPFYDKLKARRLLE